MLLDKLQTDLASAQKNRDQARIDTLRFLLGAVFNLQIEKYPPSKGGPPAGGLTDADVQSVIKKQVRTHQESIMMFEKANRADLVAKEKAELAVLQAYLPPAMGESEVQAVVAKVMSANPGADFGQLMKLAMQELQGKADGSLVSKILKNLK